MQIRTVQYFYTHTVRTLVWIAEKTLVDKNQNKVFKLRLRNAGSFVINEIRTKWKLNSSPFNRHTFRYIRKSMSREMSTLKGEENLTGQVSFLRSKLVCNAPHNISRCCVQSCQWRDSHPNQVCTKRGQPGKAFCRRNFSFSIHVITIYPFSTESRTQALSLENK